MTVSSEPATLPKIWGYCVLGWDLLRIEGLVSNSLEEVDGKLYVDVTTESSVVPACTCDFPAVVKHGTRVVHFRDHPLQRQETYLRVKRQRYRCQSCGQIHLEELPGIDPNRNMTIRFRDQLATDGIAMKFELAGGINGVKESLVRRVFGDYAEERLRNYTFKLPRVLGMDEKVLGGHARYVVGDVENRFLLDICLSRKILDLEAYFDQWTIFERAQVEVITQDMYWGYKTLNERYFRKATIVVDKFHVLRYADFAVMEVRKRLQQKMTNEDRIAMKKNIRLLQARPERLDDDGKWALKRVFRQHPMIETAVICKEWFYDIYRCETRAEAEKAYDAWLELLPKEMEFAFKPIISYMREKRWHQFVFNYFEHPFTNAYVEAVNGLLDEISRAGRGYDLKTLRAKALLKYGRVAPLTDEVAFDLMSVEPHEQARIQSIMVGHGVDPSTFERDLRSGAFW